jgi:hypothetical protein
MADSVGLPEVAGHEEARTPTRFRGRVILAFRAPANVAYLRDLFSRKVPPGPMQAFVLETLADSVYGYSTNYGRALEVLADDPFSRRDGVRPAVSLWGEVRRLNQVYYQERMAFLREHAALLERVPRAGARPTGLRDGISEDDEPYHMRMFTEDSLRPDGWAHLNGAGPLYAILEDQARNVNKWPAPRADPGDLAWGAAIARRTAGPCPTGSRARARTQEKFTGGGSRGDPADPARAPPEAGFVGGFAWGRPSPAPPAPPPGGWGHGYLGEPKPEPPLWVPAHVESFLYGSPDAPWSTGNPERTPEQAVAEYWGDDGVMATEDGVAWEGANGDDSSWGDWAGSNGARFQRWDGIPFWQKGGHEGYELDIDESLGVLMRETGNPVRRWDMDRLRDPRGQEYRRYGARSGHIN